MVSALYRLVGLGVRLFTLGGGLEAEMDEEVVLPLRRYLRHVTVALGRFSDELLCSALQLVLGSGLLPTKDAMPAQREGGRRPLADGDSPSRCRQLSLGATPASCSPLSSGSLVGSASSRPSPPSP
jgi:hypothetical protein